MGVLELAPAAGTLQFPVPAGLEAGGKYFHLNFGVNDGRLWVHLSDQGEESADWEGDNRHTIPEVDDVG
jgi:hypothetical protein